MHKKIHFLFSRVFLVRERTHIYTWLSSSVHCIHRSSSSVFTRLRFSSRLIVFNPHNTYMSSSDFNTSPSISFIVSNKNKRLLLIDGYVYQRNKITPKVTYWVCERKECGAGVHLNTNDKFIRFTQTVHSHLPTPERLEVRKMLANIKNRVNQETTAIGHIYTEEIGRGNLSTSALALAPSAKEASKTDFFYEKVSQCVSF